MNVDAIRRLRQDVGMVAFATIVTFVLVSVVRPVVAKKNGGIDNP